MPDTPRKISELAALTATAPDDYLPIVDVSEPTLTAKNKRIAIQYLLADALLKDANGRVGLGTNNPETAFHLLDGAKGIFTASPASNAGASADYAAIRFRSYVSGYTTPNYSEIVGFTDGNVARNGLKFIVREGVNIFEPYEAMRLTSFGRLGLGTINPETKLHVTDGTKGVISASPDTDAAASADYASIRFRSVLTSYATPAYSEIVGFTDGNTSRNGLKFFVREGVNVFAPYEAMRLTSFGRLGIGSTNPGSQLEVNAPASTSPFIAKINAIEVARVDSSGRLLVGTSSDSGGALLQVNGNRIRVGTAKTPASATDTGAAGEICWDANYVYVCTATNTWKRSALSSW